MPCSSCWPRGGWPAWRKTLTAPICAKHPEAVPAIGPVPFHCNAVRAAAVWVRVAGILAVLLGVESGLHRGRIRNTAYRRTCSGPPRRSPLPAGRARPWPSGAAAKAGPSPRPGHEPRRVAGRVVLPSRRAAFGDWWLQLVEANVIASSAVALAWLAARRRLYQLRELTAKGTAPICATQPEGLLRQIGPVPFRRVACEAPCWPRRLRCRSSAWPPCWRSLLSGWCSNRRTCPVGWPAWPTSPGWLALLLVAAAAAWYLGQVSRAKLLHVVGGLTAGIGVLAACHAGRDAVGRGPLGSPTIR